MAKSRSEQLQPVTPEPEVGAQLPAELVRAQIKDEHREPDPEPVPLVKV